MDSRLRGNDTQETKQFLKVKSGQLVAVNQLIG